MIFKTESKTIVVKIGHIKPFASIEKLNSALFVSSVFNSHEFFKKKVKKEIISSSITC
jgi:hypothetical protein